MKKTNRNPREKQADDRRTLRGLEYLIRRGDATAEHLDRYEELSRARRPVFADQIDADWDAFNARLSR